MHPLIAKHKDLAAQFLNESRRTKRRNKCCSDAGIELKYLKLAMKREQVKPKRK